MAGFTNKISGYGVMECLLEVEAFHPTPKDKLKSGWGSVVVILNDLHLFND